MGISVLGVGLGLGLQPSRSSDNARVAWAAAVRSGLGSMTVPFATALGDVLLRIGDAVEDVAADGVSLRDAWVVEVEVRLVRQAELFHDAARGLILHGGVGVDGGELQWAEGVVECGACAFSGEATVPGPGLQTPADLDGAVRDAGNIDVELGEADEAVELARGAVFSGEEGVAVAVELVAAVVGLPVALFAR